jgi:iron-sulfur cluster assembly accessory protein
VIALTPAAAERIRAAQAAKGVSGYGLRVQVVGGGCEGFLYDLLYADEPESDDLVFESEGQRVFVDPRSHAALDGLIIDHGATPYGSGFLFANPRARAQCSCGASFSA